MHVLFWNINGVSRRYDRVELYELVKEHKPDIIGLAEPRFACSPRFKRKLNIIGFSSNIIHNSNNDTVGNIWVMWSSSLPDPVVVTRRSLWQQLGLGNSQVTWLVVGDFNCVLRLEKKKGGVFTCTSVVNEFGDWLDDNGLFEAEALGSSFTWSNRPSGDRRIISKLDRVIINEALLEKYENWRMVQDSWDKPVVGSPTYVFPFKLKRLKADMKEWNKRVFGNVHIRLKQDQLRMENALRETDEDPSNVGKLNNMKSIAVELNNTRFIHIRRSSNTISELVNEVGETITNVDQMLQHVVSFYEAKFNGDYSVLDDSLFDIDHATISPEESIGLSNFFFKIFTKILATRLGTVLGNLVSEEHVAFIKGRNIHENISLASEMVNELQIKRKDGNVGLKLDITQAFDTVSWKFIMEVFRRYGFSEGWCTWILHILQSARISVLFNGSPEGFFKIDRGLRQGDPLSPLSFVLIEDVLSRNIAKFFRDRKMTHMTVIRQKSKLYYGGGSLSRRTSISNFLVMEVVSFPDRYLGVKIMPGTVRYHHISNVVEKIKEQLSGWKGKYLSFQDRVVLVTVIASYSIHNMAVYHWTKKFVHQFEVAIRNFIWTEDSSVQRSFTVAYDKICVPYEEGGLESRA
ncbi:uncharacterized protein LOC113358992 [Papaver somniferum]|uniref:uncharacterized protein LOC113358992 n=1 Tax=Papaver somniferum TaxID=3469 RepID=UPI000E6F6AF1|nr:uncharacterized protein LOC113358992 [Papaver somniferum]